MLIVILLSVPTRTNLEPDENVGEATEIWVEATDNRSPDLRPIVAAPWSTRKPAPLGCIAVMRSEPAVIGAPV